MRSEEDGDARALTDLARLHWWGSWFWHVPNGGRRRPVEAARFRGLGVKAGVADYQLALPAHGYHGLFLELKSRGDRGARGRLSSEQETFLRDMSLAGYLAAVAWGLDAAASALLWYADAAEPPRRAECRVEPDPGVVGRSRGLTVADGDLLFYRRAA